MKFVCFCNYLILWVEYAKYKRKWSEMVSVFAISQIMLIIYLNFKKMYWKWCEPEWITLYPHIISLTSLSFNSGRMRNLGFSSYRTSSNFLIILHKKIILFTNSLSPILWTHSRRVITTDRCSTLSLLLKLH